MIFECDKGHQWQSTFVRIRKNIGCNICRGLSDLTIADKMSNMALKYNDEMVSPITDYKTYDTKLNFKCHNGHEFQKSAHDILTKKAWCYACRTGQQSIDDMKELAKKHNGECLSTEYVNLKIALKWKYVNGHAFMRRPDIIINKEIFCSQCKHN